MYRLEKKSSQHKVCFTFRKAYNIDAFSCQISLTEVDRAIAAHKYTMFSKKELHSYMKNNDEVAF